MAYQGNTLQKRCVGSIVLKEMSFMFIKTTLLAMAFFVAPSLAFATQSKQFASCYGDHHGSYLSLWAVYGSDNALAQVNIAVSSDNDDPAEFFQVTEVAKNGEKLPVKAYSWAIRQAIKAVASGTVLGVVKVTATNASGQVLYMNLNKFGGNDGMAIDGYIEQLECPLDGVND